MNLVVCAPRPPLSAVAPTSAASVAAESAGTQGSWCWPSATAAAAASRRPPTLPGPGKSQVVSPVSCYSATPGCQSTMRSPSTAHPVPAAARRDERATHRIVVPHAALIYILSPRLRKKASIVRISIGIAAANVTGSFHCCQTLLLTQRDASTNTAKMHRPSPIQDDPISSFSLQPVSIYSINQHDTQKCPRGCVPMAHGAQDVA